MTGDMYLSRVASVNGGLPVETPAFTLNRLCGTGLGGGQGIAAIFERA